MQGTASTNAPADASRMVTGTVVNVAGAGNGFTSDSDFRISVRHISLVSTAPRATAPATRITRARRGRLRSAAAHSSINDLDSLHIIFGKHRAPNADGFAIPEKIRIRSSSKPGVRLVGSTGSERRPEKKYYDVDLDEYQFD